MYQYPKHFIHPEGHRIFFKDHIQLWEEKLSDLMNRPNVCLEVGSLFGAASVFILDNFCNTPDSHLYIADINTNEFVENNLKPYKNVTYIQGQSEDVLREIEHCDKRKGFLDLVYIDGNHMSKHVLEDAVNAFYLLKPGGVIIFDDYGWGDEKFPHRKPSTGIDAFIFAYQAYLEEIHMGWQVMLRRNAYDLDQSEKESNYYINWKI